MNQREETEPSFNNAGFKDLPHAKLLDEQSLIYKSCSQENRCSVWAPDCSYVAWSQGGGIVFLLPWNRDTAKLLKKPSHDVRVQTDILTRSANILMNLPHIQTDENEGQNNRQRNSTNDSTDDRRLYRIDTGDYVWCMAFGSGISKTNIKLSRRFFFNRDLILATGLQNGKIKLWNVHSGSLLMELLDHKKIVRSLSFTSDGSLQLISCSNDCTLKFWDLNEDGNMCRTLKFENRGMIFDCKWSPNCKQVAAVGTHKNVYVWNNENWNKFLKLSGHNHTVNSCDFSPDGAILATASFDTTVILWDPYTGECLKKLRSHILSVGDQNVVSSACIAEDTTFWSPIDDKLHLFPAPSFIYAGGENGHYVRNVSFSRNGQQLVTVADDGYLRFWDINDNDNPSCVMPTNDPLCCAFSPNGVVVSIGDRKGTIAFCKADEQQVVSLQHLCRMSLRQKLPSTRVDELYYPKRLKTFLKYKD